MQRQSRTTAAPIDQDGHRYHKKSSTANSTSYVCSEHKREGCDARGDRRNDEHLITLTEPHSHPPLYEGDTSKEMKDRLWLEVNSTEDDLKSIYLRVAREYDAAATTITWAKIERSMKRWRMQSRPPVPATLHDFGNVINLPQWEKYRIYPGGRLTVHTVVVNVETSVTIIGDQQFLATLDHVQELLVDCTFKVCPHVAHIAQFLTIMGRIDDTAVPIAWALMSKKNELAYRAVFQYFHTDLAPSIEPRSISMDFEIAIANAISAVYNGISIVYCHFHHVHALLQRVKQRGAAYVARFYDWDAAKTFFRKLAALALLPANDIAQAYHWLVDNAIPDLRNFFHDLIDYYENWWLNRVTPAKYSVFGLRHRTNNAIESYHKTLTLQFGIHPGIWKFIAVLRDLQINSRREVNSLNMALPVRRRIEGRYLIHEELLRYLWESYTNARVDIPRFLACANYLSSSFQNDMVFKNQDAVDNLLIAPTHNRDVQPPPLDIGNIILENHDDLAPAPIIKIQTRVEDLEVFIVENLPQSFCRFCQRSIVNVVALPCQHWFLCLRCTQTLTVLAARHRGQIMCNSCFSVCEVFRIVEVT